jgi:hypothetical protein
MQSRFCNRAKLVFKEFKTLTWIGMVERLVPMGMTEWRRQASLSIIDCTRDLIYIVYFFALSIPTSDA